MTFREKRQAERFAAMGHEREIVLKIGVNEYAGKLVNFSVAGALIELSEAGFHGEIGDRVSAFFQSGSYLFNVEARIVRSTAHQLAIHFCDLSSADKKQIKMKLIRMQILASRISH
jgi:hypothetical protein